MFITQQVDKFNSLYTSQYMKMANFFALSFYVGAGDWRRGWWSGEGGGETQLC